MESFVWSVHKVVDETLTRRPVDGLPQWAIPYGLPCEYTIMVHEVTTSKSNNEIISKGNPLGCIDWGSVFCQRLNPQSCPIWKIFEIPKLTFLFSNCAQISHCVALSWGRDLINVKLSYPVPCSFTSTYRYSSGSFTVKVFVMTGFHCYLCFYCHQSKCQKLLSKWL